MEQVVFEAAMNEFDKGSHCVVWVMLDRNIGVLELFSVFYENIIPF
jgi:hypothetical protein